MKTTFAHILCSFILIFASVRGAFVYHLDFPSNTTYSISALMLLGLGVFSLLSLLSSRLDVALVLFKNTVILNVMLFVYFIFGTLLLAVGAGVSASSSSSMLYYFLVFPTVFIFLQYDDRLLARIICIIALITVIGVFYFFNLGLAGGFDAIYEAHSILRPGAFQYSRLGVNLLPFGYAGSHHDTANILVMCGIFFLTQFFICAHGIKSLLYLACYFVILSATLLTGSGANVLVLLFMSVVSLVCYIKKSPTTMLVSFFLFISLLLISSITLTMDLTELSQFTYVFGKFNSETMDPDLWASLDAQSFGASIVSMFFGFGEYMEAPLILSEVAFVSLLSRVGFLPFSILMFIGFSPIYYIILLSVNRRRQERFMKKNKFTNTPEDFKVRFRDETFRVLMTAMPVLTGFLTLVHYASVFRITSIGLFCILLAMFLREYLIVHQDMTRVRY